MVHLTGTQRKPLILEDNFVTVPINDAAAQVIHEFMRLHIAELDADLERFGITMSEIKQPNIRAARVRRRDSLASQGPPRHSSEPYLSPHGRGGLTSEWV